VRRVVVLRRGKTLWHIDVPDADDEQAAIDFALEHANGVKKPGSTRWLIHPSNGKPTWEFEGIVDQFPHELEAEQMAAAAEKLGRPEIVAEIAATRARLDQLEGMLK
jgi:hypothetical protein